LAQFTHAKQQTTGKNSKKRFRDSDARLSQAQAGLECVGDLDPLKSRAINGFVGLEFAGA
jgi:hypothetical protein